MKRQVFGEGVVTGRDVLMGFLFLASDTPLVLYLRHAAPAGWTPKLFSSRWISRFKVDKFFFSIFFFPMEGKRRRIFIIVSFLDCIQEKSMGRQQVPGNRLSQLQYDMYHRYSTKW